MFTKDEIIKEIQKYTQLNDGKTPSESSFYENTDVNRYERMKHWSNYGELVREAGLTPNKFDKTKYSHDQLCEIFITVIREKRKWPTRGDLDVKHHNDLSFPNSATFYKKLGLTRNLAKTILEFVENKKKYKDIVEICNLVFEGFENLDRTSEDPLVSKGFVYLGKQHGDYKIGKAKDANRRREDITLLGSEPFKLIHEIETDDMDGIEKYWHTRFTSKRKRGEWFNLNSSDVKAFKRWRKIY